MSTTGTTPYQAALDAVKAKGGKVTRLEPRTRRVKKDTPMPASTKKALDAKVRAQVKARDAAKKPTAKKRSTGNGSGPAQRLSNEWPSAKGKDVAVKDLVRMADGTVIEVIGRWTKRKGDALVPMITGHIVKFPAGATASAEGKGKKVGDRQNAVAAEVTHTK
jgi:hypothetical protein